MKLCPICKQDILKGEKLTIVAFPLTSKNSNGDYNFAPDFLENERVCHFKCLNLENLFNPVKKETIIAQEVIEILKATGIKISKKEVEDFVSNAEFVDSPSEEIVKQWLKTHL